MAFKIPVADEAVAEVAVTKLLERILASEVTTEPDSRSMALKVLEAASRVQFQPSTRRLVLSFDLAMSPDEDGD
jgi:hypothetical protein